MISSTLIALSGMVAGVFALPAAEPMAVRGFASKTENPAGELVRRAKSINYNQNYVASGANVQYSPNQGAGSFSVKYNTQQDFVVGLGWTTGDSDPVSFSGSFSASGVGILSLYGWTTNPLVEYYVMEESIGYPKQGQQKGTFTSDGATYEIWQHQQTNQPSIQGTSTFQQYISIRQSPRASGTITVKNHFDAWSNLGMKLGTQNYQVMAVESWSGSGQGQISVSKGTSSGGGSTGGGSTGGGSTGGGSTGGGSTGGAAQWGQCGGTGWSGASSCASPFTCKFVNDYYSQCQ